MPIDQLHENNRLKSDRGEMTFFDHLSELRRHLLRAALAIMAVALVFFFNKEFVFNTLLFGPRHPNFPTYRLICQASRAMGLGDQMCFTPPVFKVITRELGEVLMQQIYVSFWLGVIGAFPYIFWEFWRFIRPGLLDTEQQAVRGLVFICSFLFLSGVLFGYFIIAPFSISFLGGYTVEGLDVSPTLDSYVTYMTMFTLPTGLIFEMPIVSYFFTKVGLIGPAVLRMYRRHAVVAIVIVAAIITPPDVVSQTLVAIPLFLLYEISIWVSFYVKRNRERELLATESKSREVRVHDDEQ